MIILSSPIHGRKVRDREGNELTENVIKLLYHPDSQMKAIWEIDLRNSLIMNKL